MEQKILMMILMGIWVPVGAATKKISTILMPVAIVYTLKHMQMRMPVGMSPTLKFQTQVPIDIWIQRYITHKINAWKIEGE
jgi:hypothetical protein